MEKYFVFIVLIFFCLTGCQNKEAISALDELRERTELEEINMDIANNYFASISTGDFDAIGELLSDGYEVYSPSGYPEPTSKADFLAGMIEAVKSFPEFVWNVDELIAVRDKVICRIIITGKFDGEIPGVPSGEREFRFSLISILRMEDGKIVEEWQEDDQLGFARQMGMELAPAGSKN